VNQTGFISQEDYAVSGSGSIFVMGYFDAYYQKNMSRAAIKEFLKQCIALAVHRDESSGGCCRLLDITEEKVEREFHEYKTFPIQ